MSVIVPHDDKQISEPGWWRELAGIVKDVDDFDEIMRDVIRSRRRARPRRVDLEG